MARYASALLALVSLGPAILSAQPADSSVPATRPAERAGSGSPQVQAQVPPADARAATEAATAYLGALKAGGFGAASAHLHPDALARFKALLLPAFESERARGTRSLLNATFGRDATFGDARAAAPADFMGRFLRVIAVRNPEAAPGFDSLAPVGVLQEGDRLHVLVRLTSGAGSVASERLKVVSLRRDGSAWKVLLDDRLESMAQSIAGRTGETGRRAGLQRMEPFPEGSPLAPPGPVPSAPAGPGGPPSLQGPLAPAR